MSNPMASYAAYLSDVERYSGKLARDMAEMKFAGAVRSYLSNRETPKEVLGVEASTEQSYVPDFPMQGGAVNVEAVSSAGSVLVGSREDRQQSTKTGAIVLPVVYHPVYERFRRGFR